MRLIILQQRDHETEVFEVVPVAEEDYEVAVPAVVVPVVVNGDETLFGRFDRRFIFDNNVPIAFSIIKYGTIYPVNVIVTPAGRTVFVMPYRQLPDDGTFAV